jgi:hypothetical protein
MILDKDKNRRKGHKRHKGRHNKMQKVTLT